MPAKISADRHINTTVKLDQDQQNRLPNERDESPDAQTTPPREVMKQAASDIKQGLVDTDRRATPGVEKTVNTHPQQAKPIAAVSSKRSS